jgi:hypothetical protein
LDQGSVFAGDNEAISDRVRIPKYLKKIVASNWVVMLECLYGTLGTMEIEFWPIHEMVSPTQKHEKGNLETLSIVLDEINTLRRRVNWYCDEMVLNLDELGIQTTSENSGGGLQICDRDDRRDFLSIYEKLKTCRENAGMMMTRTTDIINIVSAKYVNKLTILGMGFVPLSLTASLFSMGGEFSAGRSLFWVYFVISIPLFIFFLGWTYGYLRLLFLLKTVFKANERKKSAFI